MDRACDHETGNDWESFLKPGRDGPKRNKGADVVWQAGMSGNHPLELGVEFNRSAVGFCPQWWLCPRRVYLICLGIGPTTFPTEPDSTSSARGEAVVPSVALRSDSGVSRASGDSVVPGLFGSQPKTVRWLLRGSPYTSGRPRRVEPCKAFVRFHPWWATSEWDFEELDDFASVTLRGRRVDTPQSKVCRDRLPTRNRKTYSCEPASAGGVLRGCSLALDWADKTGMRIL
jgi:hypothetical protein